MDYITLTDPQKVPKEGNTLPSKSPAVLLLTSIGNKENSVALRALDCVAFFFYCVTGLIAIEGLFMAGRWVITQIKLGMGVQDKHLAPLKKQFRKDLTTAARDECLPFLDVIRYRVMHLPQVVKAISEFKEILNLVIAEQKTALARSKRVAGAGKAISEDPRVAAAKTRLTATVTTAAKKMAGKYVDPKVPVPRGPDVDDITHERLRAAISRWADNLTESRTGRRAGGRLGAQIVDGEEVFYSKPPVSAAAAAAVDLADTDGVRLKLAQAFGVVDPTPSHPAPQKDGILKDGSFKAACKEFTGRLEEALLKSVSEGTGIAADEGKSASSQLVSMLMKSTIQKVVSSSTGMRLF